MRLGAGQKSPWGWAYFTASLLSLLLIEAIVTFFADKNLPPLEAGSRIAINALLANFIFSYVCLIRCSAPDGKSFKSWWGLLGVSALAVCAIHPVFSGDLMEYLIRGRIFGLYHQSPYRALPQDYPGDLLYGFSTWKNNPDSYGPLFVYIESIPAILFPESVRGMIWCQKALLLAGLSLGVFFFGRLAVAQKVPDAGKLVTMFALNPLLIVATCVDGHNDAMMLSFTIASIYFYTQKRFGRSLMFWTGAFLIKYTVVLLLPFLVIGAIRHQARCIGGWPWKFMLVHGLLNAAAIFFCFAPLWAGRTTFLALIRASDWFYTNTIPYALRQGLRVLGLDADPGYLKFYILGAYGLGYAGSLVIFMRDQTDDLRKLARLLSLVYLGFYLTITIPFGKHYLLWALPWLVFARWPKETALLVLYSSAGLFAYWKRMNYLLILAALAYAGFCAGPLLKRLLRRERAAL